MPSQSRTVHVALVVVSLMLAACAGTPAKSPTTPSAGVAFETELVAQKYGGYTPERAEQEGYTRDKFCLDSASFGLPAQRGAMGFHATNNALLRGPIDPQRPQALMFDATGRVIGVEYEIVADAVTQPPQLFGHTFSKLPPHAGVEHEHYALHLWFIDNPAGRFADFNPRLSCPAGSAPRGAGPGDTPPPGEHPGH